MWDGHAHTAVFKMQKLEDPLVSTRIAAQGYVAAWMGGEFGGEVGTCVCVAESFCGSPKNIITLLIGYTPHRIKSLTFGGEEIQGS